MTDQPQASGSGAPENGTSAAADADGTGPRNRTDPAWGGSGHFKRLIPVWLVLALAGDLLFIFLAGPHLPPGDMSSSAASQQVDFTVIGATGLPVVIAVIMYYIYAVTVWRAPKGENGTVDGPPIRSHLGLQTAWISITAVVVLSMFVYGTVRLIGPAGAGGGEGPAPIWTPTSKNVMVVQVIGQQWKFTYRYPSFGGFETDDLVLPDDTTIAFHVTSLDVIHSFWAYGLGVKADANPGTDNVAFTTTQETGTFEVRCGELCGLWHGAMYNYGTVESKSAFEKWATTTETQLASLTKLLPPFAWSYTPDANGADGGYYEDWVDPYSNAEMYQATKSK